MTRETCWTLIRSVRDGDSAARDDFVRRYLTAVQIYLRARWSGGPLQSETDDAVNEVFIRCFSESGPLENAKPIGEGGFRGFLYGICRNVAREMEAARKRHPADAVGVLDVQPSDDDRLSAVFDRAFARQVMKEVRNRYNEFALQNGPAAQRRFELLTLRFEENLPIRTIASRWGEDAAVLHKEYAKARQEYRSALLEVVAEHDPGRSDAEVEAAARELVELIRQT